jgi:transcriptional regulator with GAF, ATPase, and Fis domain
MPLLTNPWLHDGQPALTRRWDGAGDPAIYRLDASGELLRTISQVLDIRTVFTEVSTIANRMLPHDALVLVFADREGRHFVRHAVAPAAFPDPPSITLETAVPDELIIDDFTSGPLPVYEPSDAFAPVIAAGYRALLSVRVPAHEHDITLGFWSKRPGHFDRRDVLVARRIAVYVALAISHEQLATSAQQVVGARARAEQLEHRVQQLSAALASKSKLRVIGESCEWLDVLKQATRVADTETTVLLTGASGTGKEVLARFIHGASARAGGRSWH